jgi:phosphopantothenoylcysteine synthetase/decarboxylase
MAIAGREMPLANEPNEDQTGVDVIVRGGLPADGQDLGAAADTGDAARAEEVQAAQETRKRADLVVRKSTHTPEDVAARQEKLRVIQERRAAEDENIDADKRELA